MSQSLFSILPYDWANGIVVLAGYFFGVMGMVLVLWELVLFYKMGVEFKGQIFLICSRRVKWQEGVAAGIGLSVYNVLDGPLHNIDWYSGVVVGRGRW